MSSIRLALTMQARELVLRTTQAAVALLFASVAVAMPPEFTFSPIADPTTADYMEPTGISENGNVTGHAFVPSSSRARVFVWDAVNGSSVFDSFPDWFPLMDWVGKTTPKINDSGMLAGVGRSSATTYDEPAIWTLDGGIEFLGGIDGASWWGGLMDLNNAGQAVGWSFTGGYNAYGPFVWSRDRGIQRIPGFVGHAGIAYSISEAGAIAGACHGCASDINEQHAFYWSAEKGFQVIPLSQANAAGARGVSVNANGQVLVNEIVDSKHRFFLWSSEGGLQDLEAPDFAYFAQFDLNNDGAIIITGHVAGTGWAPFLYHGGTWWDLNDLVTDTGNLELTEAAAINNAWQIVGTATDVRGVRSGFLLTRANIVDTTPPAIVPGIAGTLGDDGWYVSDVEVTWDVTDPESVISEKTGCNTVIHSTDTTYATYTCSATSQGGTSSASTSFKRDATPPDVTAIVAPAPNSYGWNNTNVWVTYAGTDAVSGAVTCDPETQLVTEGTDQGAKGECRDAAGNSGEGNATGISIDKTPPTISILVPEQGAVYSKKGNFAADFACADALSGVLNCSGTVGQGKKINLAKKGATTQTFTVIAVDLAGNESTQTVVYEVR